MLSHQNLLSNCHQIAQFGLFAEDARILANLPLFHSFGFTITTLYPLLEGLEIVSATSPLTLLPASVRFGKKSRRTDGYSNLSQGLFEKSEGW